MTAPDNAPAVARLDAVALDCPDPRALARFYSAILGWPFTDTDDPDDDGEWVTLDPPDGRGAALAFQRVGGYRAPRWPGQEVPQQLHLDLAVPDLDTGEQQVLALGARRHEVQPAPQSFRVYLDPVGHPFCLVRDM